MPGRRRSIGSVDRTLNGGSPSQQRGGSAVAMTYHGLGRGGDLAVPKRYFSEPKPFLYPMLRALPTNFDVDSSDDDTGSESSIHEGFENLRWSRNSPPRIGVPGGLSLPPTPPTLNNSDTARASLHHSSELSPVDFAPVAAQSLPESSKVVPLNHLSPPTPGVSPPTSEESLPVIIDARHKPVARTLKPFAALTPDATYGASIQSPSSCTESFRTAKEYLASTTERSTVGSPVFLAPEDELSLNWLSATRGLNASDTTSITYIPDHEPEVVDSEHLSAIPSSFQFRALLESPPDTAGSFPDLEKHISYVSGPDELDDPFPMHMPTRDADENLVKVFERASGDNGRASPTSAENVNNLVYQHLQEENAKRHSGVSSSSGVITASVVIPPEDTTPKRLKRTTKCASLRDESSPVQESSSRKKGSPDWKKIRQLSPVTISNQAVAVQQTARHVSSPPKLQSAASGTAALTSPDVSMSSAKWPGHITHRLNDQETTRRPSRGVASAAMLGEPEHKLRHYPHGIRRCSNSSARTRSDSETFERPDFKDLSQLVHDTDRPLRYLTDMNTVSPGKDHASSNRNTKAAKVAEVLGGRGVAPQVIHEHADTEGQRPQSSKSLRHFSREERIENIKARRISWSHEHASSTSSYRSPLKGKSPEQLSSLGEGSHLTAPERRSDFDPRDSWPSPRKSLDVRNFHPNTTPLSISQLSDDVSLHQASGVRIYSHNNNSIRELDLQQSSRPGSNGKDVVTRIQKATGSASSGKSHTVVPNFMTLVDPPTPKLETSLLSVGEGDSPLTNPRAAPEPPIFKFIPPTPEPYQSRDGSEIFGDDPTVHPQRRLSILQMARRYSEVLLVRTGSLRRPRHVVYESDRPSHLSPMWKPDSFWNDDYYDDDDEDDDFEPSGTRLPAGGDTSDVESEGNDIGRSTFPRKLSKRLPGFRGTGGFLLGNSVGIERHGSNNRRHYVSTGTRALAQSESDEIMRHLSGNRTATRSLESLRRSAAVRRGFVVPFTGGLRAHWVGAQRFRNSIRSLRRQREERAREKRREQLREQIGPKVFLQQDSRWPKSAAPNESEITGR